MRTDIDWFESWFNSPYYHILYEDRDDHEARLFLDHLLAFLKPAKGSRILDVACGKGRHALYLNEHGYDVTGFDLSPENIQFVQRYENEQLAFFQHDMREIFRVNYFDFVFNLFSSFGYFEKEYDNARTIYANATALKPGGILVLDYMNSEKVKAGMKLKEVKKVHGIDFHISRELKNGTVIKKILFSDQGVPHEFYEQLSLFTRADFEKYFIKYGLTVTHVFGDYNLTPFDEIHSDRMIMLAKKNT